MLASTFRWVMTTPLGSDVAPDVNTISAVSPGAGAWGAGGAGGGAPASAAGARRSANRQVSTPSSCAGATSSPTSRSRASTRRAMLPRKSDEAR